MSDFFEKKARFIFLFGFIIFICTKLSLVLIPIILRAAPVEPDDAYAYILKAEQLKHGFDNCPGLEDMKAQTTAFSSNPKISFLRYKYYLRVINHYHLLHSILLAGLNYVGFSWERAYNIIQVVGLVFICMTAGYWLYVMWGPAPAGVALLLLACYQFPGHGLHETVPSNISLSVAMLCWALIMSKKRSCRWFSLLCIMAMLAMHPIARLYALASLAIYTLLAKRPLHKRDILFLGAGLCIVSLAFAIPCIFSLRGHLTESWYNFGANVRPAGEIFLRWTESFGGYASAGFLALTGFLSISKSRRRDVLVMAGMLLVLLSLSIFYVMPNYPAHLFTRLLLPVGIFFAGAIARSLIAWITAAASWRAVDNALEATRTNNRLSITGSLPLKGWAFVVSALVSVIFLYNIAVGAIKTVHIVRTKVNRQRRWLDPSQPQILLTQSNAFDSVFYKAETPMFFYFSQGGLSRGAICYPILKDTPQESKWLDNNNIRYMVDWSPIPEGRISLSQGRSLNLQSTSARSLSSVYFNVENPGRSCVLELKPLTSKVADNQNQLLLQIPASYSGWLRSTTDDKIISDSFTLEVREAGRQVNIRGIRIDTKTLLNWPWDQGISIRYVCGDGEQKTACFETSGRYPKPGRKLTVIADKGSSILLEVENN